MSTLDDWITEAAAALDLPAESIPIDLRDGLLELTRDVAHGVTRIAGPLTTYLVGRAVGAGMESSAALLAVAQAAARHIADSGPSDGDSEG